MGTSKKAFFDLSRNILHMTYTTYTFKMFFVYVACMASTPSSIIVRQQNFILNMLKIIKK